MTYRPLRPALLLALTLMPPGAAAPVPVKLPVPVRGAPAAPGERRVAVAPAETLSVTGGPERGESPAPAREAVAVVLLPGPVGSAFSLRTVVRELATRGIVPLVIDPLGMGASTRPAGADYTLSAQADRIARVLDRELPTGATVVIAAQGTSATIALHLAAADTARVRGVLSIAGGPIDKQGTPGVRTALTFAALLDNPIGRRFAKRRFVAALREQSANDAWLTDDVATRYVAPIQDDLRGLLRTLGAMQASVERRPIEGRLPQVSAPVRLLVGDKPSGSAPTTAQIAMLQTHLRRFRVDTLRPGGTMLHEERAADVARVVDELMRAARR